MQRLDEHARPVAPLEVREPTLLALVSRPVELVEADADDVIRALVHARPLGDEKAALAEALLALLSNEAFGHVVVRQQTLRHEVVDAVLRLGYPWALQLEPGDVAALQPRHSARRGRLALIVAALLVAGLATFAALGGATLIGTTKPHVAPFLRPAQGEVPGLPPATAEAVANRVAELRRGLLTFEARALAEGCVVAFEEPRPCVEELIQLLPGSGDTVRDRELRREWARLSDEPGAVLRARARPLFVNEFAREAARFPPPSPEEARVLMFFIERSAHLLEQGKVELLVANASNCVTMDGQHGAVCRDFLMRAGSLIEAAPR